MYTVSEMDSPSRVQHAGSCHTYGLSASSANVSLTTRAVALPAASCRISSSGAPQISVTMDVSRGENHSRCLKPCPVVVCLLATSLSGSPPRRHAGGRWRDCDNGFNGSVPAYVLVLVVAVFRLLFHYVRRSPESESVTAACCHISRVLSLAYCQFHHFRFDFRTPHTDNVHRRAIEQIRLRAPSSSFASGRFGLPRQDVMRQLYVRAWTSRHGARYSTRYSSKLISFGLASL